MRKLFLIGFLFLVNSLGFAQNQDWTATIRIQPPRQIFNEIICYCLEYIPATEADVYDFWDYVDVLPEIDEDGNYIGGYLANGNVIGEFMCNEIIEWTRDEYGTNCYDISDDDFEATCITLMDDFWEYGKGKTLYGWRINDLKIYDRPIPVTKFKQTKVVRGYHKKPCDPNKKIDIEWLLNGKRLKVNHLTGAPQSWCYVDKMRGIRYG